MHTQIQNYSPTHCRISISSQCTTSIRRLGRRNGGYASPSPASARGSNLPPSQPYSCLGWASVETGKGVCLFPHIVVLMCARMRETIVRAGSVNQASDCKFEVYGEVVNPRVGEALPHVRSARLILGDILTCFNTIQDWVRRGFLRSTAAPSVF